MKAVLANPDEGAQVIDVDNDVFAFQELLGGLCECHALAAMPDAVLMVNMDEQSKRKKKNRYGFYGSILIVCDGGKHFRGLTEEEAEKAVWIMDSRMELERAFA